MIAEMHEGPMDGRMVETSESAQVIGFPDGSVYRASEHAPYDRLHFHWHRAEAPR